MSVLLRALALFSILMSGAGSVAWAAEIYLKDGTRLIGKVVSMEDDTLKVESPLINDEAELTIDWENVERIVSEEPLQVEMVVEEAVSEHEIPETARIEVTTLEDTKRLPLERVERINVPEVRYEATVDLGGNKTSGNTDTGAVNLTLDGNVRTPHHILSLGGKFNWASADGKQTAQNSRLSVGYAYLFTKKWFVGILELLEQDKFQDLTIRSSTGLALGYKPLDSDRHKLMIAIGPGFVYQDFETTGVTKTPTSFWAIRWEYEPLVDKVELFHNQTGYRDFGSTSDALRWNADQGVRVTLWDDLYIKMEFDYRFNSEPEPGKKQSDEAFIFGLGYKASN